MQEIRKSVKHPESGEPSMATVVEVTEGQEPTSRYLLSDGTQLRLRFVLVEVLRFDEPLADGTPGYSVSAQMVANFHVPQQKDDADDVEG